MYCAFAAFSVFFNSTSRWVFFGYASLICGGRWNMFFAVILFVLLRLTSFLATVSFEWQTFLQNVNLFSWNYLIEKNSATFLKVDHDWGKKSESKKKPCEIRRNYQSFTGYSSSLDSNYRNWPTWIRSDCALIWSSSGFLMTWSMQDLIKLWRAPFISKVKSAGHTIFPVRICVTYYWLWKMIQLLPFQLWHIKSFGEWRIEVTPDYSLAAFLSFIVAIGHWDIDEQTIQVSVWWGHD